MLLFPVAPSAPPVFSAKKAPAKKAPMLPSRKTTLAAVAGLETHPAFPLIGQEFVRELEAHPVYCLASQVSVQRWKDMIPCSSPSQNCVQQWHVAGMAIGLKQRRTLLCRDAWCAWLVLRLLFFQGDCSSRYPFNLAKCIASQRHFLGPSRTIKLAKCIASRRHFLGPSRKFAEFCFQEGQRFYRDQRFSDASQLWGQAALLNHGPSHAFLSDMLIDGLLETRSWDLVMQERLQYLDKGTPVSRQAFALASAGAALGCAHSKGALARCLMSGIGTRVSQCTADKLASESAQSGSCIGQYVLGLACKMGGESDTLRGKAAAVRWLFLAAEQGHAAAQFDLSIMYSLGDGVAKDKTEAGKWKEKARAQGHIGCKRTRSR